MMLGVRPFAQRVFTLFSAVSLMLCVATAFWWSVAISRAGQFSRGYYERFHVVRLGAVSLRTDKASFILGYQPSPSLKGLSEQERTERRGRVWREHRHLGFLYGGYDRSDDWAFTAGIPTPLALTLLLVAPSIRGLHAVRRRRRVSRRHAGRCPSCNYDLRASAERCPECGTATR